MRLPAPRGTSSEVPPACRSGILHATSSDTLSEAASSLPVYLSPAVRSRLQRQQLSVGASTRCWRGRPLLLLPLVASLERYSHAPYLAPLQQAGRVCSTAPAL